tara:strand:- start:234 stop:917 length:684 start_codon:yes stop_codon:yes gene_type:complete
MGIILLDLIKISHNYHQGNEIINVIDCISCKFQECSNVGLIGPSGSGKSTLLHLIGLLEKPQNGKIVVDGLNVSNFTLEQQTSFRKKHIGFMFQNNQLLDDFTSQENVALPLILNGFSYKKSMELAGEALQDLGLKDRLKLRPSLLSGGEQQRVAIMRAMIKKPKILLSDEPTGSLDNKNSIMIFEYLKNLVKVNNTLCITATHNLNLIKYFDICYEIKNGKLIKKN